MNLVETFHKILWLSYLPFMVCTLNKPIMCSYVRYHIAGINVWQSESLTIWQIVYDTPYKIIQISID